MGVGGDGPVGQQYAPYPVLKQVSPVGQQLLLLVPHDSDQAPLQVSEVDQAQPPMYSARGLMDWSTRRGMRASGR